MSKWSEMRAIKFLDIYEKHECLWNNRIEAYKDRTAKSNALEAILKELNMPDLTPNDIKLKIKSIRTTYKRELTAVLKSLRNQKTRSYTPKLFWFSRADRFLRDVSGRRGSNGMKPPVKTYDEAEENFNEHEEEEEEEQTTNGQVYKSEHLIENKTINETNFVPVEQQPQVLEQNGNSETIVENAIYTPYRDVDDQQEYVNVKHQPQLEPTTSTNTTMRDDDEFALFCRSVAAQLRSIPDSYSRAVAKFKIQQILFEAETGHYKKSTVITIPSTQTLHS